MSNKKENKKEKVIKHSQSKKATIIISTVISIISAAVGCIGGYVLYKNIHPEQDEIVIEKSASYDKDQILASLKNNSLETDYSTKCYDLINYACDLYSNNPYSLTLGQGIVHAAAGVNQTILSATYNYPEGAFNQKTSNSSLVKTADRYYDDNSGNVKGYECSVESEWKKDGLEAKNYTYDEYIQKFGKLLHGNYYCIDKTTPTTDEEPIPESFLTLSKEEFDNSKEQTKHQRSGVIAYSLTKKSVSDATIKKNDSGYEIVLNLDVKYAVSYISVQMKSTGRLKSRPQFSGCKLTFQVDNALNLLSSTFHDEYRVNTGGLVTSATSDLDQIYLTSTTNKFQNNNHEVDINVPQMKEDFNGYELLNK